jgi:hypothetical protein
MDEGAIKSIFRYLRETAGLTFSEFLKKHSHPVLLSSQDLDWTEKTAFQFETVIIDQSSDQQANLSAKTASQVAETLVFEVKKQARGTPSNMICVGRTGNNDIVFANPTISKFHAYFAKSADEDSYEIVDVGSTNGTRVNNQRLTAHQSQKLANGDRIEFGPAIEVIYFTAQGFYDFMQHLLRPGLF